MFDKVDIGFGEPWPGNILSNMWHHPFEFGGIQYPCMESFLQSLKFPNEDDAARIREMSNFTARREGQKGNGWKQTQKLYWDGTEIDRQSSLYYDIVSLAYEHMFDQNPLFRLGVRLTYNSELDHSIGVAYPEQTILTRSDFINFICNLREKITMSLPDDFNEKISELLNSCSVLDTETTAIDTKEAEIIQLAFTDDIFGDPRNVMYRPVKPIPPEASAIHHISNRMVRGLPTFGQSTSDVKDLVSKNVKYFIAHNSDYDRNVLINSCIRDGLDAEAEHFKNAKWICTWRLAKAVLGVDYTKLQYNLSYLRYALDLEVDDALPAHDGRADVIVCAKLFEYLVYAAIGDNRIYPDQNIGQQLYDLCWKPKTVATWPFGKHKGKKLSEIPTDFYFWAIDNVDMLNEDHERYDIDLATSVANELSTR